MNTVQYTKQIIEAIKKDIVLNCDSASEFEITLKTNITLSLVNTSGNKKITVWFIQDSIGSRTVTFNSQFIFTTVNVNTVTSTANATTVQKFDINDSKIYCSYTSNAAGGSGGSWGSITGTLADQTDLNTELGLKSLKTTTDPLSPLTNQTFSGQFNLSTNYEVYYNAYTTNTTVTPTVSATPLVGAVARVVFDAGSSAALTATNLGTLRAGSDTFTVSKLNEILVFSLPEGLEYSIKVLN